MAKNIRALNSTQILSEIGIKDWNDNDFAVLHKKSPDKFSIPYPFRSTDYLIGFVIEGTARSYINLQEITLHRNSLIIIKPYDIIEKISQSDDLKVSGLTFTKEFIVDHVSDISLLDNLECLKQNDTSIVTIKKEDVEKINALFLAVDFLAEHTNNPYRKEMIKSLFKLILYGIDIVYQQKEETKTNKKIYRKNELTNQFRKLLLQNYREQRGVSFYANNLYVTAKYLSESVKEITGKTAGELIDDMVILEAKILLKNSRSTISEIADTLHFNDQFFFSKFFKNHIGLSPLHYRQSQ